MNDAEDRKARRAENKLKIFNNRVKYFVFFLTVTTGVLTIWEKCGPSARKPITQMATLPADSLSHSGTGARRKDVASPARRHHSVATSPKTDGGPEEPAPLAAPLERAVADNVEFRLMRAEGSIRAQTIKMTVVLMTNGADGGIRHNVQSIIDDQGNEYSLKSFTNGASGLDTRIALSTGVPIRCTFTFAGVLPAVGTVKLFKFQYWDNTTPGKVDWVEFKDIPVKWE